MARHIVRLTDLVAIARRVGVTVVEAPSSHRGKVGEMGTVIGVTCHWTGTSSSFRPTDDYPDYNVVKEGRPGLDNSLSAFGLGRFKSIYVFSEDLSYHAGVWNWQGITDGNGHFLGIEAAGSGSWTEWQRRVYPRLVASILLFIDSPVSLAPTHAMGAMPRGRKSDFPTVDTGWAPDLPGGPRQFHAAVAWLMSNPNYININYKGTAPAKPTPVEDDMPTAKEVAAEVVKQLRSADMSPSAGTQEMQNLLSQIHSAVTKDMESLAVPGESYDPRRFVQYIDRHVYQLNREKLPQVLDLLNKIVDLLSPEPADPAVPPAT